MTFGPGLHAAPDRAVDLAAYDAYLGRWSRLFVPALLDAASIAAGDTVLDLACGPGEATVLALQRASAIVAADISPRMVEAARTRIRSTALKAVVADGQALPFGDATFDAVVCQLGLQFFPDPGSGLREARRVLRAGRRVAICVISRAPMWSALAEALSQQLPELRGPLFLSFALSDHDHVQRMFEREGYTAIDLATHTAQAEFASLGAYWSAVAAGVGTLPQAYSALAPQAQRQVRDGTNERLGEYVKTDGRFLPPLEMVIASGQT